MCSLRFENIFLFYLICSLRFENYLLTIEGVRFASISKKTPLSKLSFTFVSLALPLVGPIRREIITVRGQSYVFRLPKYWPPTPPLPLVSVYPPPLLRGEDTLAGWRGGWGVNILEDARHSSVLYLYRILFGPIGADRLMSSMTIDWLTGRRASDRNTGDRRVDRELDSIVTGRRASVN